MLLDLVFPRRCVVCGGPAQALCGSCSDSLRRLGEPRCERCGAPTAWPVERCRECSGRRIAFASARAAVAYDDAARLLVAAWKERGLRKLAALAAELVCEVVPRPSAYTLTFVPADPNRRLDRGHNPAERLAVEIGARWQLPVALAPRREPTASRRSEACRSPSAAATCAACSRQPARAPGALVLVDDVYTSGATVSAAATALRKAGARRVEVVTFARAVR